MNPHFRDILAALSAEEAEFLVVGAYALAGHGLPRATGDLDVWIRPSAENARRVWQALLRFGAPLLSMKLEDFQEQEIIFRMGLPPNQIDIITSISGVSFEEAWPNRIERHVEGVRIWLIGMEDQLRNKRAADRPKDKVDADWLERRISGEK
jgi:hypothetical protein